MPEVHARPSKPALNPVEKLQKAIADELDIQEHHERRARESAQRRRDYIAELAKMSGTTTAAAMTAQTNKTDECE